MNNFDENKKYFRALLLILSLMCPVLLQGSELALEKKESDANLLQVQEAEVFRDSKKMLAMKADTSEVRHMTDVISLFLRSTKIVSLREQSAAFQTGIVTGCIPVYSSSTVVSALFDAVQRKDYLAGASFATGHVLGLLSACVLLYYGIDSLSHISVKDLFRAMLIAIGIGAVVHKIFVSKNNNTCEIAMRVVGFLVIYGIVKTVVG